MMKNKHLIILLLIGASTTVSAQNYKKIGECVGAFNYASSKKMITISDLVDAKAIKQYQNYVNKVFDEKLSPCSNQAKSDDAIRACMSKLQPKDKELMEGMFSGSFAALNAQPGVQTLNSIIPVTNRFCFDAANSIK